MIKFASVHVDNVALSRHLLYLPLNNNKMSREVLNHNNIVMKEDDGTNSYPRALLAADSSPVSKRITVECVEDDDLDLDNLLRLKDDDDDEPVTQPLCPHDSLSSSPPASSTAQLPTILSGRNIFAKDEQQDPSSGKATSCTSAAQQLTPTLGAATEAAAAMTQKDSSPIIPPPLSPTPAKPALVSPHSPRSPTLAPILAREEDDGDGDEGFGHWVNPPSAKPGDFLNTSLRRVPSKSILKKVSSYGNFDSSMSSHNAGGKSGRRKSVSMSSEEREVMTMGKKKTSFLSMASANSNHTQNSGGSSYGVGLDLGDSISLHQSPRSAVGTGSFHLDENTAQELANILPLPMCDQPSDADQAAGPIRHKSLDSSCGGNKMHRSVSFHSVDIREYDRTIGDNPSCRSGPPLSLDWSYSKKYEKPKSLDEYEKEREPERVNHFHKLHVNKYRRKNLLAFNWGHSEDEMKDARKETRKLQRQRSMTQMLLPIHLAEEAYISVKSFISKKRGKSESPRQEMQRVTSELSLSISNSTKELSHSEGLALGGANKST